MSDLQEHPGVNGQDGAHDGPGQDLVHADGAGLPARFPNPGLPAHHHRMGDTDPIAARRAERQVAALFVISMVATVGFIVAYFTVSDTETIFVPGFGTIGALWPA